MEISSRTIKILPYLLGTIFLLFIIKPSILFKPNGKTRNYGSGYDEEGYKKSFYTVQFAIILVVIILLRLV